MEVTPLASLSLTHVFYNPNDPLSYLCAWLALLPQALCVIYCTLLWSSREVEILLMFTGQMGCEALNFALKRFIKQERPKQMNGKGYGMPSSHAQFMSYFAVAMGLFLLVRHRPPPGTPSRRELESGHTPLPYWQRVVVSVVVLGVAGLVAGSRVYLSYHTPVQVFVGGVAGIVSAVMWYGVTEWLRREGWVEWGLDTRLAKMGRWKDLVVREDLVEGGWRRWVELKAEERRKRGLNGTVAGKSLKDR